MNEIKVTVTYDKPNTSKFDALMAEYEVVKKIADETEAYYKPLADMAEITKFNAIMEQLEIIKGYAKRIGDIKSDAVWITAYVSSSVCGSANSGGEMFQVIYRPNETTWRFEIRSDWKIFDKNHIGYHCKDSHNFIGNWNEWRIFEKLEEEAIRQLQNAINEQKRRAEVEINRLNNITKGGN